MSKPRSPNWLSIVVPAYDGNGRPIEAPRLIWIVNQTATALGDMSRSMGGVWLRLVVPTDICQLDQRLAEHTVCRICLYLGWPEGVEISLSSSRS